MGNKNNLAGKLLHLKRFYVQRVPLYLKCLERLTSKLNDKPKKQEVLSVIRSEMVSVSFFCSFPAVGASVAQW